MFHFYETTPTSSQVTFFFFFFFIYPRSLLVMALGEIFYWDFTPATLEAEFNILQPQRPVFTNSSLIQGNCITLLMPGLKALNYLL